MAELNYTPQDILQQQFKTKMRGYDPEQVDEYLDNIIRDYESYQKELIDLQEENDYLRAQVDKLAKQSVSVKPVEPPKSTTVTNFDILKRLSNLEREVFGKKINEAKPEVTEAPKNTVRFEELPVDDEATRLR
ncbi:MULTISPECIES: cell division regulator GpsB [unclassified Enterococcus]|uniref:cell division regulator GpsB n=1 Tax=unclassified Enterococcus TaxID=2608891 RepID=UPI001555675E|nr:MULTISPECIES: cell division regulator GpsB [unclassified Enterococcus]MBS7577392.1 cell division regulator GpsB [Enterococcus sp. MMGLQ5-2]MBS7584799.1 cell division regulator GpsB [Enterococcus sp. MMGLQ5-1]NPD12654.1 cell division regulator GpsB [Enterococcus sp. MMGLQ5-1]NPD37226.1 cell division regulator GpsB [Enterococcus sp. MMGLQ5-2]